jgi:hypothetical protein
MYLQKVNKKKKEKQLFFIGILKTSHKKSKLVVRILCPSGFIIKEKGSKRKKNKVDLTRTYSYNERNKSEGLTSGRRK